MTIELKGNWNQGFAYDNHIVESTFLGYDEYNHEKFANSRSAMGELVYQLKYQNDISKVGFIILVSIFDLIGVFCLRFFILYAGQLTVA